MKGAKVFVHTLCTSSIEPHEPRIARKASPSPSSFPILPPFPLSFLPPLDRFPILSSPGIAIFPGGGGEGSEEGIRGGGERGGDARGRGMRRACEGITPSPMITLSG